MTTPIPLPGQPDPAPLWAVTMPGGVAGKVAAVVAFIAVYVALDWVSIIEPFGALGITPWNPPAGLLFAGFLLYGPRFVPAAVAAVLCADVLLRGVATTPLATLASAPVIAVGYGWVAMVLRDRLRISIRLTSHHELLWLLAAAFGTAAVVALTVVWIYAASSLVPWADFALTALQYWIGDVIGIAVLTPFLLLLVDRERRGVLAVAWTPREAASQLLAIAAGLWIIFGLERTQHFEYAYVLFLPLIWIALRHGLFGATFGIVATQIGLILAIQLRGYDAHIVTQFQLLMLAVTVSGLFLGSVVDERRRADASLRESEERLQTVISTAPDAIFLFEPPSAVISANAAAERMFVLAGRSERLDLGALLPQLDLATAGAGVEMTARRLDGTNFVAEVALGQTQLGGRTAFVAVVRDVSLRKQAEIWLKGHEAELAHAARLMTTGEMAAAIAHELNQPLTAVIGFARACQGLLQSADGVSDEARKSALELVDQAVQQAMRAGQIIRSTREFLKRDDMQFAKVPVSALIKAVLDLVQADAQQKGVRITTKLADELPLVFADPIQIEQVLLNLIRNSVEAITRAGSPVKQINVGAVRAADGGFVEFRVDDSGPGFAPEMVERLFTPFATTKDSGMGLGMAISRTIVEAHGGRIWAAVPAAGAGADIHFTIPVYNDDADVA
jgi:signal transduction histidine kinase